ncbi:MAG: LysM peptidoglycan-binding domain-containing protein [Lachnospiraceae bacterium]|nr:LysM peptidoglycan-binding domain-containing protein [Lachnospiraceae bacterium]
MSRREKRRVKRIRQIITIGTVLFLLLIGCFGFSVRTANADSTENKRYKYYTSIQVKSGDTLWSIADEYITEEYSSINRYIKEVQKINHLEGTTIITGSTLVVPYYSDEYKL